MTDTPRFLDEPILHGNVWSKKPLAPSSGPTSGPAVSRGTLVTLRWETSILAEKFGYGEPEDFPDETLELVTTESPAGLAIDGHRAGETVEFVTKTGGVQVIEIVDVVSSGAGHGA